VPLFLDFLVAASFVEFTDLLGDLLAKFDDGGVPPSSASPRKKTHYGYVNVVPGHLLNKMPAGQSRSQEKASSLHQQNDGSYIQTK